MEPHVFAHELQKNREEAVAALEKAEADVRMWKKILIHIDGQFALLQGSAVPRVRRTTSEKEESTAALVAHLSATIGKQYSSQELLPVIGAWPIRRLVEDYNANRPKSSKPIRVVGDRKWRRYYMM